MIVIWEQGENFMGLDMYAYAVDPKECENFDEFSCKFKGEYKPDEIYYWRKHHDLHGWMENLYRSKGGLEEFNCQKVMLTVDDLNELEKALISKGLPSTTGFFFGNNPPDEETLNEDLLFIAKARKVIEEGNVVYYDSWW